jgi:hypothetical protein
MRQLLLLLTTFLTLTCSNRDTIGEIDGILQSGNYKVELQYQGCFGAGTEKLEIRDNRTAIHTFFIFGQDDKEVEKIKTISWTPEKEKTLKEIFEAGIQFHDTIGMCTTTARYILTSRSNSVEFEDLNCEVSDKFEALLK